jgi:ATP-dependent DNA helicase RecG
VVDKAVDFVMDSLARWVDPSSASVASDVTYEIPYRAVREAVVNAVAHRNYASKAAVQVMVFADRVEVWSPGGLPEELSVDQLRKPHHSVPPIACSASRSSWLTTSSAQEPGHWI